MFFSDKLLDLGRDANPKSNISQYEQSKIMLELLQEEIIKNKSSLKLQNIVKMVCKQLNKEGYLFYKFDIFYKVVNNIKSK